jgi:hypothetical protein
MWGLARESARTACIDIDDHGVIAIRRAPTVNGK